MQVHPNSPLGLYERLKNIEICPLCFILGNGEIHKKRKQMVMCSAHIPSRPRDFKCSICCGVYKTQIMCCNVITEPRWFRKLEWLRGLKNVPKWMYAQSGRNVDVLDDIGMIYGFNGTKILENVNVLENMDRILRESKIYNVEEK